jgi:hypothetical protein
VQKATVDRIQTQLGAQILSKVEQQRQPVNSLLRRELFYHHLCKFDLSAGTKQLDVGEGPLDRQRGCRVILAMCGKLQRAIRLD